MLNMLIFPAFIVWLLVEGPGFFCLFCFVLTEVFVKFLASILV